MFDYEERMSKGLQDLYFSRNIILAIKSAEVTYITNLRDDRHMQCLIRNYGIIMLSSIKFIIVFKTTIFATNH